MLITLIEYDAMKVTDQIWSTCQARDIDSHLVCVYIYIYVCRNIFFLCKFSGRWVVSLIKISFFLLSLVGARYPEEPFWVKL